ncbi:MAG: type II toxin-antitoxin system VapC family toxin [Magnetococcales bacterium]|nr:type II toxin-antitoxin system VapC family toxin [Magnetococcales bacterium]
MSRRVYLLDTNILLTALIAPERLPAEVRTWLSQPRNDVFFSAASIWEIAIKCSLQREGFTFRPEEIHALALETGFTELAIQSDHGYPIATMPWHHRDPFDRMLVAQAQSLPAHLLTTDSVLKRYSELVVVVGLVA